MTVEIVILAMIAAFLGLRLYSVLGRRAEHGEEPVQHRLDTQKFDGQKFEGQKFDGAGFDAQKNAVNPAGLAAARQPERTAPRDIAPVLPSVERGLRDIAAADRRFDPQAFIDGARSAYRMILEAFWRGDKDELVQLCDRAVAASFAAEIDARLAAREVVENRLVRIEELAIVSASYVAPVARIAVRFVADIAAITRDAHGTVIAGSLDDAVEVRDVWTFTRDTTRTDPDWLLDETDEG